MRAVPMCLGGTLLLRRETHQDSPRYRRARSKNAVLSRLPRKNQKELELSLAFFLLSAHGMARFGEIEDTKHAQARLQCSTR
jgi:hypothetical protein